MRLNQLKIIASAELRVAAKVQFAILDLRKEKKPKLTQIWPRKKSGRHSVIEVSHKSTLRLSDHAEAYDGKHIVLVIAEGCESQYPNKEAEQALLRKVLESLKKQSWVSLLKDGAKELFRQN